MDKALLKLLAKRISRKKYLGHVGDFFRELSSCRCAGVRVLNEDGTIPYEYCTGFGDGHWKAENWLSIKESQCACTRVMTGKPDPQDAPHMTPFGTFLSNDIVAFMQGLTDKEKSRFRGVCMKNSFRSLAIIPIRYGPEVVATIHLADEKEGMLPIGKVAAIESLTPLIGEAIQRFGVEDKLRKNYAMQRVVNALMRMSLDDAALEDILSKALEKIRSVPWLPVEQKGCIFLVKDRPGILELITHKGLPKTLLQKCSEVPFGKCFCGRTASEKVPVFSMKHGDDQEEGSPHGHYCLPIMKAGSVLGVVNFYIKEGQRLDPQLKEFLSTIANALAGIIMRKEAEKKLKDSSEQLRRLATHLQASREDERTEFAREVHDELGQALTALKMDIYWLRSRLPKGEKTLITKADSSLGLIDSTIKSVKRICTELRPDVLDHLGLAAAVEWQIDEFRKRTGIKCRVRIRPREIEVDRNMSIALFRVIQEALTNIIRHANAGQVDFVMEKKNDCLYFRISDDGKGILKKHIQSAKSFGLLGIRERVRFWNGSLHIEGAPARGTTLSVTVPLKAGANVTLANRAEDNQPRNTSKPSRDNKSA